MPQTRIMLNLMKPSNNAFFDPVTKLHLTKQNPMGIVNVITPHVLNELRGSPMPGLIDLDHKIDLKTGKWKEDLEKELANNQNDAKDNKEVTLNKTANKKEKAQKTEEKADDSGESIKEPITKELPQNQEESDTSEEEAEETEDTEEEKREEAEKPKSKSKSKK